MTLTLREPAQRAGPRNGEPPTLGEYNGFEIYPMPFFATLPTDAPERLARWYEEALGFGAMFRGPMIHLRRKKYQDLLIVPGAAPAEGRTDGPILKLDADGEIGALADRLQSAEMFGQARFGAPTETPWNTLELEVVDPCGYRWVFTSRRAQPDAALHAEAQAMFDAGRRR